MSTTRDVGKSLVVTAALPPSSSSLSLSLSFYPLLPFSPSLLLSRTSFSPSLLSPARSRFLSKSPQSLVCSLSHFLFDPSRFSLLSTSVSLVVVVIVVLLVVVSFNEQKPLARSILSSLCRARFRSTRTPALRGATSRARANLY